MPYTVPEHHVLQFSSQVALTSQQKESKLAAFVRRESFYGEGAEALKQYGETEFVDLTDPIGDTAFDSINKTSRWCFPSDKKNVLATTREDELRTIINTTNPLQMGQAAALGRLIDTTIITAALGTNQTGKYDSLVATPLPAAQKLNDNATPASITQFGLTYVKDAKQKFDEDEIPEEGRCLIVTPAMLRLILDDPEATSYDYNTVKALVAGEVDTFLGFKWIKSNRLPTDGNGIQSAIAYHRDKVVLGMWSRDGQQVFTRIGERSDKNYATQVYSKLTLGATRLEEVGVIEIKHNPTGAAPV